MQGGSLILRDQRDFKTYTARCVGRMMAASSSEDNSVRTRRHHGSRREQQEGDDAVIEERYLIYARTHCGDEHYRCIWLKNRGNNAMEFQIGETRVRPSFAPSVSRTASGKSSCAVCYFSLFYTTTAAFYFVTCLMSEEAFPPLFALVRPSTFPFGVGDDDSASRGGRRKNFPHVALPFSQRSCNGTRNLHAIDHPQLPPLLIASSCSRERSEARPCVVPLRLVLLPFWQ